MKTEESALVLALNDLHESLGARMVSFAGYRMPVQYADGLKAEHLHTRQSIGLFDVSHMGQIRVSGPDTNTLHQQLEDALPVDFDGWTTGEQRYSVLLNDAGGIEDDLMIANLGEQVQIVVNAGNREADLAMLKTRCPDLSFAWVDAALIALQGPLAETALAAMDARAATMRFMQVDELKLNGTTCLTSRSGYTGEDGYEISIPTKQVEALVTSLLTNDAVKPIGLGARDSLRLEAGLPLHGNDIYPEVTPIQANLPFAIAKSRRSGGTKSGGFPGASVILDQLDNGVDRKLCGLISADAIPVRSGCVIVDAQGKQVGEVTSGTISPCLNQPVMLAYLDSAVANAAPEGLCAQVRNKTPQVSITKLPFVPKRYKR